MGIFDKIKAKIQDPEVQQKAKDAVAKAQQKRQGGGVPGGQMYPQSGRPMGSGFGPGMAGGYVGGQFNDPYNQQDSDGDGIPDSQDNQPYGGPEDYTGQNTDMSEGMDDQGDVQYVDEQGNAVDAQDVQGGDYEVQDDSQDMGGGDFDTSSEYDSGDSYDSGFDSGSDYDSGSSFDSGDSGSFDSGGDSGGGDY